MRKHFVLFIVITLIFLPIIARGEHEDTHLTKQQACVIANKYIQQKGFEEKNFVCYDVNYYLGRNGCVLCAGDNLVVIQMQDDHEWKVTDFTRSPQSMCTKKEYEQ